jgi:hypothetical protein
VANLGEGVAEAIGLGETSVTPPPELREVNQLSQAYREWEVVVGPFTTGDAAVPPQGASYLDDLHKEVYAFKAQKLDPMAQELRDQSVDPDRNFQFEVVGMASRSWAMAPSNAARLRLNEELSQRRASAVETEINNRFADVSTVRKRGAGAHAVGPTPPGGGVARLLDDAQAQAVYEAKKSDGGERPTNASHGAPGGRSELRAAWRSAGSEARVRVLPLGGFYDHEDSRTSQLEH